MSTVDYCPSADQCPYQNAYWDGEQMVYGAGFPAADDVDAHELTHAVTQSSANLLYYKQSGALNESFSDIFGETVDLTNSGGTDTAAVRWLIGEDIPGIGAIRNMMNPPAYGNPGKVSDPQFQCSAVIDRGGVHTNSGVPNHAYALMVDGGTYNAFTIMGIGLTKAGKIQYRALAQYLVSGSKFLDDYLALQQSCADLIGIAGISTSDCTEMKKALDAVEMSKMPCT
ncbi:MAG: M4 family metallopeptidase [Deltaproteobacteria bacterium]|nr:M4 family metallopeptidase [Deltaproteobacteria bacterium]